MTRVSDTDTEIAARAICASHARAGGSPECMCAKDGACVAIELFGHVAGAAVLALRDAHRLIVPSLVQGDVLWPFAPRPHHQPTAEFSGRLDGAGLVVLGTTCVVADGAGIRVAAGTGTIKIGARSDGSATITVLSADGRAIGNRPRGDKPEGGA